MNLTCLTSTSRLSGNAPKISSRHRPSLEQNTTMFFPYLYGLPYMEMDSCIRIFHCTNCGLIDRCCYINERDRWRHMKSLKIKAPKDIPLAMRVVRLLLDSWTYWCLKEIQTPKHKRKYRKQVTLKTMMCHDEKKMKKFVSQVKKVHKPFT